MLVCQNISPQQGKNYYLDDVSFTDFQEATSSWHGQGATYLNLVGSVKSNDFQSLLAGKFVDGTRFRKLPNQSSYKQRGAIDCIFAAPKSVSLLALVNKDVQLLEAHSLAVDRVLEVIENRYSATRIRTQDGRITVNTRNLVIAKFPHSTSRELDPHLHTHCVILNMTKTKSDRWLSLKNDDIFLHQKFLGKIYQNELAFNIKQLGYSVQFNLQGQMEIDCNRAIIEAASKRHQQIQAHIEPDSSWQHEKLVWATTRKPKQNISAADLQQTWGQKFSIKSPAKTLTTPTSSIISQEVIDSSHQEAQKWHPTNFCSESIEENILELHPGRFSWSNISNTISRPVNADKSPTVLTIETVNSWQNLQNKWQQLTLEQRKKTLTIVAENNLNTTFDNLEQGKPWNANPHKLKSSKIIPFQHIFVLKQEDSPKINHKIYECLRRLKRTFKSRIKNTICDLSKAALCDRFNHLMTEKPKISPESPEYYQQWYSSLKAELGDNSDLKIAQELHQQHIPLPEIRKVLARSDRIHQLRQLYAEDNLYHEKAVDYIESVESSLFNIPLVSRKNSQFLEKSEQELEM